MTLRHVQLECFLLAERILNHAAKIDRQQELAFLNMPAKEKSFG
jgi:hypothetical protein